MSNFHLNNSNGYQFSTVLDSTIASMLSYQPSLDPTTETNLTGSSLDISPFDQQQDNIRKAFQFEQNIINNFAVRDDNDFVKPNPTNSDLSYNNFLFERLKSNYDIIDHQNLDGGIGVAVIRNISTGLYTVAFDGTELNPANAAPGETAADKPADKYILGSNADEARQAFEGQVRSVEASLVTFKSDSTGFGVSVSIGLRSIP